MPFSLLRHPRLNWMIVAGLGVGMAGAGMGWRAHRHAGVATANRAPATPPAAVAAPVPPPLPTEIVIAPHTNFTTALATLRVDSALAPGLLQAARPVYNLAHIQAGETLSVTRDVAGAPRALAYQIDASHTLHLTQTNGAWSAAIETVPYVTTVAGVAGTVSSSLFGAVEAAGEHDQLALGLASIFAFDMDFYTDPQPGDVFRVLVEKKTLRGKFTGYGNILAAEYINAGHIYDALRFDEVPGLAGYYRPSGEPMKRAFLRSPLKFAAPVSSGFSEHRFHPILKVYRAHLGTDYAAPTGTPVQTIGAGVVTRAGMFGGDGNMVQIQHASGYQTLYLHLSRILVRAGARVAQGERIGLVGMTGLATGPHLDFRIEHNGQFEDFELLRKKLPLAEPVGRAALARFNRMRDDLMPRLTALKPVQ